MDYDVLAYCLASRIWRAKPEDKALLRAVVSDITDAAENNDASFDRDEFLDRAWGDTDPSLADWAVGLD